MFKKSNVANKSSKVFMSSAHPTSNDGQQQHPPQESELPVVGNLLPIDKASTMVEVFLKTPYTPKSTAKIPQEQKMPQEHINELATQLATHSEFVNIVADKMCDRVLGHLLNKYGFEPTEKYVTEIESKKRYINQLDQYLEERKIINATIKNNLQQFLHATSREINQALETFTTGVHAQIMALEGRHGIDKMKHILLDNDDDALNKDNDNKL